MDRRIRGPSIGRVSQRLGCMGSNILSSSAQDANDRGLSQLCRSVCDQTFLARGEGTKLAMDAEVEGRLV